MSAIGQRKREGWADEEGAHLPIEFFTECGMSLLGTHKGVLRLETCPEATVKKNIGLKKKKKKEKSSSESVLIHICHEPQSPPFQRTPTAHSFWKPQEEQSEDIDKLYQSLKHSHQEKPTTNCLCDVGHKHLGGR